MKSKSMQSGKVRRLSLLENKIRKMVKEEMLKEDDHTKETINQSARTIDRILDLLRGLQRDLYSRAEGSSNKEVEDEILKLITPLAKLSERIQLKIDDMDDNFIDPAGGRGLKSHE